MTEPIPDVDLLGFAQQKVRESVAELKHHDADVQPFMLFLGPYGGGLMPLEYEDDTEKDLAADAMTATLFVARATEAIFVSTVYMVVRFGDPNSPGKAPREDPDSVEAVWMVHMRAGHPDNSYAAKLARRANSAPDLGPWDSGDVLIPGDQPVRLGGRFADAMHLGFQLVDTLPQGMITMLDAVWKNGEVGEAVARFMKVQDQVREGRWPLMN